MNNKMKTTILSALSVAITMTTMGVFANPVTYGNGIINNQNNSVAVGNGVVNTDDNSIGLGNGVVAGDNTIAIGNGVGANNTNTIAIGNGVQANSTTSIAIGYGLTTDGNDAVNIGNINKGATTGSVLIGAFNTINHANYGVAIGNAASVVKDGSVAIGHNSLANTVKATPTMVISGTTYNLSGINPVGTVSVGDTGKERTITNVAAGRVIDGSTDAVNGSQLKSVVDALGTTNNKVTVLQNAVVDNHNRLDAVENTTRDINTTMNNTVAQVNTNTKDISDLKGKVGISSALQQQVQQAFDSVDNKISQLERGTNAAIASVSALSSLHWDGFDAHNKLSFSAGFGHYKNTNAGALGVFYAPNENVMFYVGQSFGSSSVTNASVNFKVGKTTNVKRDELKDLKERVEMLENLLSK